MEVILSLYRTVQFLIGAYQDYQSIYVPSKSSSQPGKLALLSKLIKYSGQILIINYASVGKLMALDSWLAMDFDDLNSLLYNK